MTKTRNAACAILWLAAAAASAQTMFWPARYRGGAVPQLPTTAVGGGEVIAELEVDASGAVTAVKLVRTTPPFGSLVVNALHTWQLAPAEELLPTEPGREDARPARVTVASKTIVVGMFRPPTLLNTATLGEPPRDVAPASDEVPLPVSTTLPPYPPTARDSGVVVLEASINAGGGVDKATVVVSAPPFDAAARDALMKWRFRPARWRGRPSESVAYVMFGFAVPIG